MEIDLKALNISPMTERPGADVQEGPTPNELGKEQEGEVTKRIDH